jgi:hypothetical protein
MADKWFYVKDGQQCGPVLTEELQQLCNSGVLNPLDVVWKVGMDQWVPISSVAEMNLVTVAPPSSASGLATSAARSPLASRSIHGVQRHSTSNSIWTMLQILGAAVLLVACFVPWWKMTVYKPDRSELGLRKLEFNAKVTLARKRNWYRDHIGPSKLATLDAAKPRSRTTFWLRGYGTGSGVLGLLFGILAIASVVVHMRVRVLRTWAWISCFGCAVLGLIAFLFFFLWLAAPAADVDPILKQGISLGPYLTLLGGLALVTGGIVAGIQGLREFLLSQFN